MKFPIFSTLALTFLFTLTVGAAIDSSPESKPSNQEQLTAVKPGLIYGHIAQVFADGVPRAHFSHQYLDNEIARKALENYLNSLDFDHSIFLASDIEQFQQQVANLDDYLRRGQVQFAYDVFDLYKKRLYNRVNYTNSLLNGNFNLNKEESYRWKRKDAPWPADEAVWNDLWRKKIKHEYLSLKVNHIIREKDKPDADITELDAVSEQSETKPLTPREHIQKKYGQFWNAINSHDSEWILQIYLTAFAQSYDAHSSYLSPRANEDFDINMKLSLTGIGALLNQDEGAAKVVRLIPGGPAELDGRLKPGDKIIAVGQDKEEPVDIMYWPLYKSVRLIRGEKGSTVTLSVIPAEDVSGAAIKNIDLVRDEIKLENRAAKLNIRAIEDQTGDDSRKIAVITLPEFYADFAGKRRGDDNSRSSSQDVKSLLDQAKQAEVDGLILDLRNNGGGSLQEAIEMTGFFIDEGPVVQVKGGNQVKVLEDPFPSQEFNGPMLVLVNRMSASASEILAGALQDYGRALIVGDSKTHGKGTVQALFPLDQYNDKLGALKITTANFYRINGDSTQLKGIEPDIVIPSALDVMEIGEEYLRNVLGWSAVQSTNFSRNDQLASYVELLSEKSSQRLQQDKRYGHYQELVQRLKARNSIDELSLKLDERIILAHQDKDLEDFQDELVQMLQVDEQNRNSEEQETTDLILDESLNILSDLIDLKQGDKKLILGYSTKRPDAISESLSSFPF